MFYPKRWSHKNQKLQGTSNTTISVSHKMKQREDGEDPQHTPKSHINILKQLEMSHKLDCKRPRRNNNNNQVENRIL